jgi:DNA-binding NtrC family response regulator
MQAPELTPDALALLEAQPWRGNIRELRNVLEQATMRSDTPRIEVPQIEAVLRESGLEPLEPQSNPERGRGVGTSTSITTTEDALLRPLSDQVAELESRAIAAAMRVHGGNKAAVAKALGISRATLYARLEMSEIYT